MHVANVLLVVHAFANYKNDFNLAPFVSNRDGIVTISRRDMLAEVPRTLCLLHIEGGFMSARSPISVDIKHKKYTAEYEIDRGVLYVFFEGRSKSSSITGPGPELLARLLLIELVFHAPSWRDHPRAILRSGS